MRKSEPVKASASFGRDAGKIYIITEWPSAVAEKWAARLFVALKGTKGEVPPEIMQMGMLAVAWRGLNSFLAADVDVDKLIPLMDEMWECVQVVRDDKRPDIIANLIDIDIEEVRTRLWLRGEIVRVHTGFSVADALSRFLALSGAASAKTSGSPSA